MAIVSQTTEVVVATIASTGAANALLTPLHRWSSSRKRVAEAVEAAAAAKRRRQQQQRALFEQQQQEEDGTTTTNPWVALLRTALPQPVKKTYSTVAAVPGQLAKSGEQAAASLSAAKDNLAAAAEVVAAAPDRARGAATQALATTRTAREAITEAPGRVEELVKATQELPGRLRQAVGEGAEAVAALEETGRKAAEAAETLPSRLPGLIETTTDDALVLAGDLAEGTALGLDAAGTALWEVTKELGGWAADSVLRPVLGPVHEYRTSTRRVQDALDEERVVALNAAGKNRSLSSAEEANVGGPEAATTAIFLPPPATASETAPPPSLGEVGSAAGEQSTASDGSSSSSSSSSSDRRTPVSRLAGLRGRFSSWRRRKRSIVAVAVADDEDDDNTAGSSQGSNATIGTRKAVLDPTPTVSETVLAQVESRGQAAPVAGLEIAAGRSDAAAAAAKKKKSGEEAVATSTAPVRTATAPPDTSGVGVGGQKQPALEESSTQSSVGGATAAVAPSKEAAPQSEPGAPASAPALEDEKITRPPLAEDGGPVSLEPRPVADIGPLEQVEEEQEGGADRGAADGGISTAIASGTLGLKPDGSATAAAAVLADDGLMRGGVVAGASAGRARGDPEKMGDDNGSGHKAGEQDPPAIEGTATPSGLSRTSASTAVVAPPPPSVGTGAAATATKLAASSSTAASPAAGLASDAAAEALAAEEATATSEADLVAAPSAPTATVGPTPLLRARSTPREPGSDLPNTAPPQAVSGAGEEDREGRGSSVAKRNDTPRADAATGDESREKAPSVGPTASALKTSPEQQPPSEAGANPAAAAAAAAAGGGAGEAGQAADREGSNGSSGAWGVQPAVEFLKGLVEAAVPRKKEELKRREDAVCWERQWYPVAVASDLRQLRRRRRWRGGDGSVRFEMLGREYELLPPEGVADKPTNLETRAWRCRSIVAPDDGPDEEKPSRSSTVAAAEEVPVRESSGLLWAWPDTSPEGLEAAALASPASSAAGSDDDCCGGGGETASPWRRLLLRRHTAVEGGYGDGAGGEEKRGGSGGLRRRRRRRLEVVVVEHDVPCGYSEAVGGLLDPAHGEAVMAAAAGGGDGREEAAAWVLAAATSLSSVADSRSSSSSSSSSSAGVFRAASGSPRGQGEVVFAPPTVVGWRFEPTPPPPPPPTAAAEAAARSEEASTLASADRDQPSPPPVPDGESPEAMKEKEKAVWNAPPRRRWLRRRLSGGLGAEERRPGVGRGGGSVRYAVVLLPVGPERTKVFARLEVETSGRRLLDGISLGSRRARRGTLAKAIDDVAAAAVRRSAAGDQAQADAGRGAKSSTTHGGGESGESVSGRSSSGGKGGARLKSPAVEEWVQGAGNGGPF
ncbi:unnamed protein product [Ectocarpus sp. 8 AP-2014]